MQLGFVIDQSRCIGCHACTVACKSENDVPLGKFRTWVKYTEEGTFPQVRRSFAVLRCNQCTDAPCVTICPVSALAKRPDGIVDVDPAACIGCKACMQGCPYDALYIDPDHGTAEKCHFCAHRTERGLAPACAVVCPTEAIIPGDFHDPTSVVAKMVALQDVERPETMLSARKVEAGTGPNVWYAAAAPAGLDPSLPDPGQGSIWTDAAAQAAIDDKEWERLDARAEPADAAGLPRTVYDVAHPRAWGAPITAYLFFKSLGAGAALVGALLLGFPAVAARGELFEMTTRAVSVLGLFFLALTGAVLVADLKRPERFWYLLVRPNWSSWLARGTFLIAALGALLLAWLALGLHGGPLAPAAHLGLVALTALSAFLAASYTGWLFAQAKARVLWMRRGLALHLLVQALVAGAALLLLVLPALLSDAAGVAGAAPPDAAVAGALRVALATSLVAHLVTMLAEPLLAPAGREAEYARASRLLTHGRWALPHWLVGVGLGTVVPLALLATGAAPAAWAIAAALALAGLAVEEHLLVVAGQALPIS